jgi:hypothetical protein
VGVSAFISAIIHICNGTTIIQIGCITNYKRTFFVNTWNQFVQVWYNVLLCVPNFHLFAYYWGHAALGVDLCEWDITDMMTIKGQWPLCCLIPFWFYAQDPGYYIIALISCRPHPFRLQYADCPSRRHLFIYLIVWLSVHRFLGHRSISHDTHWSSI